MAKIYGDETGNKFQWDKLKGSSLKVKIDYIYTYYGLQIGIGLLVIIFAVAIISSVIQNSVPEVISGEFYTESIEDELNDDMKTYLCDKLGLNEEEYRITLSSSVVNESDGEAYYAIIQKIMARLTAGDLDFLVGSEELLTKYTDAEDVEGNGFKNLQEVLPEELYSKLEEEGRIRYLDAAYGSWPYLINLSDSKLSEYFDLQLTDNNLAISVNAEHIDAVIAMLEMMYE